ncbi:hypothetical protein C8R44DRAFT_859468 [Mycena epipterygia]|nr:hypothetical protein C8R44DRAFT_859468 [Mycena epipterygia]
MTPRPDSKKAKQVPTPVTIDFKEDPLGTIVTRIDPDTKIHYAICDLCGKEIKMTISASQFNLLIHRNKDVCKATAKARQKEKQSRLTPRPSTSSHLANPLLLPPTLPPIMARATVPSIPPPRLCARCALRLGGTPCTFLVPCDTCGDICLGPPAWQTYVASASKPAELPLYATIRWNQPPIAQYATTEQQTPALPQLNPPQLHDSTSWSHYRHYQPPAERAAAPYPQAEVIQMQNTGFAQWKPSQRAPIIQQLPTPHVHPQSHAPQFALPAFRVPSPTRVVLPLATEEQPEPIEYQTLTLLLEDLNRLLCTPHAEQPFHFRGTCALVLDPAVGHAARVTRVAWAIIRETVLAFNIHALTVHSSPRAAQATTQTSAIWMGAPPDLRLARATVTAPCTRCEHLLSIGVTNEDSARKRGLEGQRILVGLRHFPT